MKKISLATCLLLLLFILAGCGKNQINDNTKEGGAGIESENIATGDGDLSEEGVGENENNVVKKLKNARSSGKKMRCSYGLGEEGNVSEVLTYIQGDKYKTEINMGQMKTVSVFDGDTMYSWSTDQKVGTKMTMECLDSLDAGNESEPEENVQQNDSNTKEEFVDTLEDTKNLNCEDVDNIDFEIPSDITFTDQCEILKSQQKMMENLNK